ncbi:MAG: SWF/SNF helicase family protein [Bacilli bacterium]|nr:SWF/SNF helicase family protein [Bacilli bacterium]
MTNTKSGQGKVTSSGWNEIPGISPTLYSHFLSDIMVSRKIEDMGFDMPELNYFKIDIDMTPELEKGYNKLRDDIIAFMKENKHINLGGTYLNALLSYPDSPITEPLIYNDMVISVPLPIDIEDIILPKEEKLISLIKRELKQDRRSLVYITYTGNKAVDKRVEKILTKAGLRVALLKSSVSTEKREKWIEDRYKEGVDVIITNPKIVQTGLNIVQYPTIIFFQLDYDVRVVRQAESRAWRVGQEKECKVYYFCYNGTLQFESLKLIGSKKKASLALEGVFAEDILSLSGDDNGDSGVAALYKSLLGQVKLKEDDLDFFSEEEIIEIFEEESIGLKTGQQDIFSNMFTNNNEIGQISLFTITEEKIKKSSLKTKNKLIVGQVSIFEL